MKLINCDLGECLTPDPDGEIMPLVNMANIACGGHAGDEISMAKTIKLAKQHGVQIGGHPSYPDQINFGRISQDISEEALFDILVTQLTTFLAICKQQAVAMEYIKPHGALYHDMMYKPAVLSVLCKVIHYLNPQLALVVQAGINQQRLAETSEKIAIQFIYEAFADRAYRGTQLVSRTEGGAVHENVDQIVNQYNAFSQTPPFHIDTICFHSDNPASLIALQILKARHV